MGDLLLLSQYFLERACSEFSKLLVGLSSEVVEKLFRYAWPGNVRELENMVTQAVISESADYVKYVFEFIL
jgi:transcriptional regulator with PAS, ATPase and Fis domain